MVGRSLFRVSWDLRGNVSGTKTNEAGKKVEGHVAKSPGLSLFRREEPVDGDSDESYALHSYRSTATRLIRSREAWIKEIVKKIVQTRASGFSRYFVKCFPCQVPTIACQQPV